MAPNERFETFGSKPEIRGSRSDDILRHSLLHQNMSVVPATARSKKARSPEARALPGLWSVWADAHGLDLDLEIDFKIAPFAPIRAKNQNLHNSPCFNMLL
ncbi:hypothetical protein [Rahnella variigena]|uniref:hypothetical protein n=1 Tax=Rahnella variigena TaxID=574964 RepID=UPI0011C433F1|nr:hypothetical protein [Rahnella variigena]